MSGSLIEFSQDLTTQEAPPPLPAGSYPAEIVSAQRRISGTTGRPFANIGMRIAPESYPADFPDGDPEGITLFYNRLQIGDSATIRFAWKRFLLACGMPLSSRVDMMDLIGKTCTVDITHQEYEGENRAQVARVLTP